MRPVARCSHRLDVEIALNLSKPAVLLAAPVLPALESMLDAAFDVRRAYPSPDRADLLSSLGGEVRGAVVSGSHGLSAEELVHLRRLEIVAVFGVGLDALPLEPLRARSIAVTTTPVLTEDVADLAVGLWLAAARRIPAGDRFVREGLWSQTGLHPLTRRASGRRLGVFGLGRIGRAVARRLEPFASEILYTSRRPVEGAPYRYAATLLELAQACEALFVTAPGGADTLGVVGAEVLDALGPQGVLVNVARGSLVDEPALAAALMEGRLGAAALDVFVGEPQVAAELLRLETLVLSPHGGSATHECRAAMAQCVMANLTAHFEGRPLISPAV